MMDLATIRAMNKGEAIEPSAMPCGLRVNARTTPSLTQWRGHNPLGRLSIAGNGRLCAARMASDR